MKKTKMIETVAWWMAWRSFWTLKGISKIFKVTDRTVGRWLAEGLENHFLFGDERCRTAAKEFDDAEGQETWRIHPLGVCDWLIERAADTGRELGLPEAIKAMREPKRWAFFWGSAWDANPQARAENPPPFSWKLVAEDKPLMLACLLGEWWLSGMTGKAETGNVGGPFDMGAEMPEEWSDNFLASRGGADGEEDGEEDGEDAEDAEE